MFEQCIKTLTRIGAAQLISCDLLHHSHSKIILSCTSLSHRVFVFWQVFKNKSSHYLSFVSSNVPLGVARFDVSRLQTLWNKLIRKCLILKCVLIILVKIQGMMRSRRRHCMFFITFHLTFLNGVY